MQTFNQYHANDRDAREYQFKIGLFTLIIFVSFAAYASGGINVWWMAAIATISVTRWMIAFHELFHLRKPEELGFLIRLLPIPFAPLNLGYREYRNIHFGHHKYTATENDPDAFHILGGHLRAFMGAVTQHEQAVYRYIKAYGLSRELALMMLIRSSIFALLLWYSPSAFLAWWLVLRITYSVNDYVFFHLVHYRSGISGTFPIPLPGFIVYVASIIYGYDVVYATMHHDIHHQHTQIAAKYLPVVARDMSKW